MSRTFSTHVSSQVWFLWCSVANVCIPGISHSACHSDLHPLSLSSEKGLEGKILPLVLMVSPSEFNSLVLFHFDLKQIPVAIFKIIGIRMNCVPQELIRASS